MAQTSWQSITVVIVDPFRSDQLAAEKAASIAARCGATLTLLNTFMLPQPTPEAVLFSSRQILASAIRQRLLQLKKLAVALRRRGLEVRCEVEWDYPVHEAVVRHVLRAKPDLVVAESHRHGRVARWILANVDWELIRNCPCPLWFARSNTLPVQPHVLVAVDPRHTHEKPARLDDRLLKAAGVIANELDGVTDIVHAWQDSTGTSARKRKPASTAASAAFVAGLERQIELLATRHGVETDHCFVREGETTEVLDAFVKSRRIDVVVMGAVSRTFPSRPLIGNTAEKAIDHVACDVLVVKPAGFRTTVSRARPKL